MRKFFACFAVVLSLVGIFTVGGYFAVGAIDRSFLTNLRAARKAEREAMQFEIRKYLGSTFYVRRITPEGDLGQYEKFLLEDAVTRERETLRSGKYERTWPRYDRINGGDIIKFVPRVFKNGERPVEETVASYLVPVRVPELVSMAK